MKHISQINAFLRGAAALDRPEPTSWIAPAEVLVLIAGHGLSEDAMHQKLLVNLMESFEVEEVDRSVLDLLDSIKGRKARDLPAAAAIASFTYSMTEEGQAKLYRRAQDAYQRVRASLGTDSGKICELIAFFRDGIRKTIRPKLESVPREAPHAGSAIGRAKQQVLGRGDHRGLVE